MAEDRSPSSPQRTGAARAWPANAARYATAGRAAPIAPRGTFTGRFETIRLPPAGQILGIALAALAPLLYVYIPRPPISGSQFLAYPAMAGLLGLVILHLVHARPYVDVRVLLWLLLLIATAVATGASFLVNAPELRGSAPAELFRPVLLGVFLVYGYLVAARAGEAAVNRGLAIAAALILGGQLLLAATQVVGVPLFGIVWESDKSRPFGLLLRVTGSLGNPNSFAWIVAQAAVVMSLLGPPRRRVLWIGCGALLVLCSGSRSLLVLFPLMLMVGHILRDPTNARTYVRYVAVAAALLGAFVLMITVFAEYFPYLAQLRNIASTGSLASVNSFALRLDGWEARLDEFRAGGLTAWLVGLGSRESTSVLDNDFLYIFVRLGLAGMVVHVITVVAAFVTFFRARRRAVAVIGAEYLIFALIYGLVAESLGSWHLPLILFFLIGLTLGLNGTRPHPPIAGGAPAGRS